MYCINCGNPNTKVIDSRASDDGKTIRRRRECENCRNRFTTFEKMEIMTLVVEKSGKRIEKYNREKLEDSILKAVNKRNNDYEPQIIDTIKSGYNNFKKEIKDKKNTSK